MRGLTSQRDAVGAYYFPISQSPIRGLDLAIKSSADPSSLVGPIRGVLAELDPELPLFDIRTMPERLERSLTDRRTPVLLTAGFSLAALLLAALGIYGVLSYLVQLRTREIGIRVALGSNPSEIFRLVLARRFACSSPGSGFRARRGDGARSSHREPSLRGVFHGSACRRPGIGRPGSRGTGRLCRTRAAGHPHRSGPRARTGIGARSRLTESNQKISVWR